MYQKAVKINLVVDETKVENREMGQAKRKFGPSRSSSQCGRNFRRFNSERNLCNGNKEGPVSNVVEASWAYVRKS